MFSCFLLSAIQLLSPLGDEPLRLLPENQRQILEVSGLTNRWTRLLGDSAIWNGQWRKGTPVVLRWKVTNGEKGPWEVRISKHPDLSDARQFLFSFGQVDVATGRAETEKTAAAECSCELRYANLEIGTRYYWQVFSNITCGFFGHGRKCGCKYQSTPVPSAVGTFVTEDLAPRWIEIEGRVGNFRDLGGRIGLDGKRVRQGMIYRSQGLNDNSIDGVAAGRNRLTVADVEMLTKTLGIKTDHDLRGFSEAAGLNGVSPLGSGVRFVNIPSDCYAGIFTEQGKKTMAENFRLYCDPANYPILFHCIGGADRTGSLAYVLNGVLGVDRRELETDWESTFYPFIRDFSDEAKKNPDTFWCMEKHFTVGFSKYGGNSTSWTDRIVLYLKDCGITSAEIATFRSLMLH